MKLGFQPENPERVSFAARVFAARGRVQAKPVTAWTLALLLAALGMALRMAMGHDHSTPFLPFYPAIILATLLCGRGPGYLCATVSTILAWYFVFGPAALHMPRISAPLILFVAVCIVVVETVAWLGDLAARLRAREEVLTRRTEVLATRERELVSRLGELQALYDQSPIGLGFLDTDLRFVRVNAALAAMNGKPALAHVGESVWDFVPDLRESAEPVLHRVLEHDETISNVELSGETPAQPGVRRDWVESFYPVHDAEGATIGIGLFCEEVTELRRTQQRERLLVREVDHRAKNLLAVVLSIVQLTKSPTTVPDFKAAIVGRIQALARVHTLLMDSRWSGVRLDRLIDEELAPFRPAASIVGEGEPILLTPDAAQAVSMIVHELATNSAKHGALSSGGQVRARWSSEAGASGMVVLNWEESGGSPVAKSDRKGFGTTLLHTAVTRILAGELAYDLQPRGLVCRITFPRPKVHDADLVPETL